MKYKKKKKKKKSAKRHVIDSAGRWQQGALPIPVPVRDDLSEEVRFSFLSSAFLPCLRSSFGFTSSLDACPYGLALLMDLWIPPVFLGLHAVMESGT